MSKPSGANLNNTQKPQNAKLSGRKVLLILDCSPKSAFRNGMSSAKANVSSAAAPTLHAIVPAIRQLCGRRIFRSRRYMLSDAA